MTDKDDKNPWGKNKDKKSTKKTETPWGSNVSDIRSKTSRNSGKGGKLPNGDNIDDILRSAQDKIQSLTPSPQNKSGFIAVFFIIIAIWLFTGLYRVLPEEHAVVMTFGKWTDTKTIPGLNYHAPWPIQTIQKVNVTFERRIEVGFRGANIRGTNSTAGSTVMDIPDESLMVTGDENIIDIDFVVLWRISDAGKYLFEIRNSEKTIKKVAESAMREIIGKTEIQKALTGSRALIESQTKELMQSMLDDYNSGITINEVQLQQVNPPQPVVEAFDDVLRAQADKERLRNEADAYRNKIIPEARGRAEQLMQEAEAYKQKVINVATGDADRFVSVYNAYRQAKDVTAKRMYIETMQEIMQNSKKYIIDGNGGNGVLPYLPLEQLKNTAKK